MSKKPTDQPRYFTGGMERNTYSMKPENYIETFWEKRDGFRYLQPVERLKGKSYYEYDEDSFERKHWSGFKMESSIYNTALRAVKFDSHFWKNEDQKHSALKRVLYFIKNEQNRKLASPITPMFPFEIYLMNDGYELKYFCELTAPCPMSRIYEKDGKLITICFGIEIAGKKTNFYFLINNKFNHCYQVDNEIENYQKAINGELKCLFEDSRSMFFT